MSTFTCDLEGFKRQVAEFCKAAPSAENLDQLEAGFKCVSLHYFGIQPVPAAGSAAEIMAVSSLDYASSVRFNHELRLAGVLP